MPANPSSPHDAYFRRVLSVPANAACEIRDTIPKTLIDRIDWDNMELQPVSFVSDQLDSRFSDILYRTRLDGHPAYIYLLVEHQSRSDRFMALRIMEYLVNIWNQHRHRYPDQDTLPAVLPLVVHSNGTGRRWNAPTELSELIDLDPAARAALDPYLPRLRFLLDDVAALDLPTLLARDLTSATRVMLALHKIAPRNTDPRSDILKLIDDLRILASGPNGVAELQVVMTYILLVGDFTEADFDLLIDRLGPRAKEALMTTAERLRAEGEARGRAKTLSEQLTLKFGVLPSATVHTIQTGQLTQLRTWTTRVLTATTLDEIFA
ncbi:Rpn family recombination-promoting nuclease/putative transposase [Nocardia noduli]|uniref:Rpn family recombination-promoting nuclease/putative transposase n=1 Tax=Nocardia noduli TaxID=2815722 RepID=UPI001C22E01A|nr:Rpn family recombination-promoting nuclease/putative transposase [Nocardia noduli]